MVQELVRRRARLGTSAAALLAMLAAASCGRTDLEGTCNGPFCDEDAPTVDVDADLCTDPA
jgi:hypothetical protein